MFNRLFTSLALTLLASSALAGPITVLDLRGDGRNLGHTATFRRNRRS